MSTQHLTIKEVADYLGRSTKWVYKNQKFIPGYFKLAGSIFFDGEVLRLALKTKATKTVIISR